jgi:DNA-binding CsgD family transcriptional regulator
MNGTMKQIAVSHAGRPAESTVAVLSYVSDPESPDLTLRLSERHHDLMVSSLHVQLGESGRLQVMVLRGSPSELRAFADHVISQPGVRLGNLHVVSGQREADAAVRRAAEGGAAQEPPSRQMASPPPALTSPAGSETALTRREIEVLSDAALGMTARSSAANIGNSPHTVNAHRRTIIKKLGTDNLPAAVALALRSGLIR